LLQVSTEASPDVVDPVDIPATMMAWQVTDHGEADDVMALAEVPVPVPGPGQVLVDVWSAGLNFPDALLARGQYQEKPELPFTPGLELCGEIVSVGAGVETTRLGERVMGTPQLPHGSLAEFAIADALDVVPAPTGLDDAGASVFHIAYQTGWFGLYRRANLRVGETLLVHAAAGGVGSAAVQLGRAQGAHVIGIVGSADKVPVARKLGAEIVIDRSEEDVVEAVKEYTKGRGVDVVYDPVGGPSFELSTKVIAFEGRIVVVGFAGGEIAQLGTNHALVKNYGVLGLHWALYRRQKPELVKRANDELSNLVDAGALAPLLTERLAFEDAAAGISRIAAGETTGRLAVNMPG
jgi:NADPH2:quinone reductase